MHIVQLCYEIASVTSVDAVKAEKDTPEIFAYSWAVHRPGSVHTKVQVDILTVHRDFSDGKLLDYLAL